MYICHNMGGNQVQYHCCVIHIDMSSRGAFKTKVTIAIRKTSHFDTGFLHYLNRTDVHHDVCFQYFEYTSHKELRHNIGKQLCLQASPYPEPLKIEHCTLKGKGSSLAPEQEWVFTEVSVLSEQKRFTQLVFLCYYCCSQFLFPSSSAYCLGLGMFFWQVTNQLSAPLD